MEDRNVARFERGGNFVQTAVGSAENRLVAQADAFALQFAYAGSDALFFVLVLYQSGAGREAPGRLPRSAVSLSGSMPSDAPMSRREGDEGIDDLLRRAVADSKLVGCRRLGIRVLKAAMFDGRRSAKTVDRLPGVTDDPQGACRRPRQL